MKVIIDIDDNLYTRLFDNGQTDAVDLLKACSAIRKGTSLSDNLTNGDVIKTLFPNYTYIGVCVLDKHETILLHDINYHWWKSPYKAENEDDAEGCSE